MTECDQVVHHTVRVVLAQAVIWLGLSARAWGGDTTRDEALALLQGCLRTQSQMDRVSMRVATDRNLPDSPDRWPRHQTAESFIRRDGDRLDVSLRYAYPDEPRFKNRAYRRRAVTTKEAGAMYFAGIDMPGPAVQGIVDNDWAAWFTRYGINENNGGPLDGYLSPTGPHRVAELMAEAATLRLRGDEAIGGTPCKVVEAKTRRGSYVLWIAESKGFLPLKMTCEIGPDDLRGYGDERPFSKITIPLGGKSHAGSSFSCILEDVTVAQIGDMFVPVAGKFTRTEWYTDVRLYAVNIYERTEIELNPRFEGTDAFVLDLPDGTLLVNQADKTSGVTYEWHDGKAVAGGADFRGIPAVGSWESRSALSQFVSAIAGVALLGAGIGMSLTGKRSAKARSST